MTLRTNAPRARRRWTALVAIVALLMGVTATTVLAAPPGIGLDQCRNGSATSPNDSSRWAAGLAGSTATWARPRGTSRGIFDPVSGAFERFAANTSVTLTLGYDVIHGGPHAIDYLTHYNRWIPHGFFNHGDAEEVIPVSGDVTIHQPKRRSTRSNSRARRICRPTPSAG